jgi:cephalosporin hydroxylase
MPVRPQFERTILALAVKLYEATLARPVNWLFWNHLNFHTKQFSEIRWMGRRIWQNPLDLCTIEQTIFELQPGLLIECGTHRGGAAEHYAYLFDVMGKGQIVTIDIVKMHDLSHPRINFLIGSTISDDIVERVRAIASAAKGPIMAILDSDHSEKHVLAELELYAPLVTPNSFILVEDGVIDTHILFRHHRPGPLPAIRKFLRSHPEFEVDSEKCNRFLVTHHPMGWLKRRS